MRRRICERAKWLRSPSAPWARRFFRHFAVSLGTHGLRHLPQSRARLWATQRPGGAARRAELDRQGARAVPSLRYVLNRTPVWNKEFIANPAERIIEGEEPPTGGFGWDGRFNTLHDRPRFRCWRRTRWPTPEPKKLRPSCSARLCGRISQRFGAQIFDDPAKAYAQRCIALERFELEDPSFHPYNSKYDDYLDGKVQLSEQEQRGLTCSTIRGAATARPVIWIARGRWLASAVHGLSVRGPGRAAQSGDSRQCDRAITSTWACADPCARISRSNRSIAGCSRPDAAQCRTRACLLPQRTLSYAEGSAALLRAARHRSPAVVSRITLRHSQTNSTICLRYCAAISTSSTSR